MTGSNSVTISDAYALFGKLAGNFATWPNSVPNILFFTEAQRNTINKEYEYIRHGGNWNDFLENLNIIRQLNHKISFNMLWFLLNYDSVFKCVDYLKGLGFHNNSFIIGALLTPEYLNIRHLPENVLNLLKLKLQSKINEQPGYLLEDSFRNMLHYIEQLINKDLDNSFKQLAILDRRRGLDSSKIFTELYTFNKGN